MFHMLKKKLKDQRGLTLIELLAVIVILGIIAAIAVPSIGKLIKNTENKAVVSEGIQIINAAKMYVSEKTPVAGEIADTTLSPYLDNVKTTSAGFKVVLTIGTDGKYSYALKSHPAVALADTGDGIGGTTKDSLAQEKELLDYK